MNDKGWASGFIVLILTIFVLIIAYIATMLPYDMLRNQALDTTNKLSDQNFAQGVLDVLSWADTIYIKVPLTIVFGALIYAILNAMRREPRNYRGP